MINVAIIGATGYTGAELVRMLKNHPKVNLKYLTSQSYIGKKYEEVFESFRNDEITCSEEDIVKISKECDVIFMALPHGVASKKVTKEVLANCKVIDLGADFRLKDVKTYEKWYECEHLSPELIEEAVYGLCEINAEKIKKASLIANPGCYTTCSILSLYPLLKEKVICANSIIIDAKSGVTGAGRGVSLGVHYCETNENIKAYKIASHRHTPEIEEQLSNAFSEKLTLLFTPHLIPMNRGILTTSYAKLKGDFTYDDIKKIYENYYGDKHFIRLTKKNIFPETKWVKGSNFFDLGFSIDERTGRIVVIGAIDNLIKGASGQAIQNFNLMFGFDEKLALENLPIFP